MLPPSFKVNLRTTAIQRWFFVPKKIHNSNLPIKGRPVGCRLSSYTEKDYFNTGRFKVIGTFFFRSQNYEFFCQFFFSCDLFLVKIVIFCAIFSCDFFPSQSCDFFPVTFSLAKTVTFFCDFFFL